MKQVTYGMKKSMDYSPTPKNREGKTVFGNSISLVVNKIFMMY